MYVCQLSLLQLLIWAGYRHFKERLPEAICCCLQTCNVDVVLLVMYCMYIPGFINPRCACAGGLLYLSCVSVTAVSLRTKRVLSARKLGPRK